MTQYPRVAAFAASLALAGCGLGAPAFPTFGETSYRIEGVTISAEGAAPVPTVIYRDGPRMRVETTLPGRGPAIIVFNEATNAAYVLAAATPPAPTSAGGVRTSPAAAVAAPGVAIRVNDAEAPKALDAPWAALGANGAQSAGACNVAGEEGHNWLPKGDTQGIERTACITPDGIILQVREGERVLFEASRLERGPQAASLFGVPPGYQVVDPQAIMAGVGETMEQLDSVTGAAPPSAPAVTTAPPQP